MALSCQTNCTAECGGNCSHGCGLSCEGDCNLACYRDCGSTCVYLCYRACTNTCYNSCLKECHKNCGSSCTTICKSYCRDDCTTYCDYKCTGTCKDRCDGTCSGECKGTCIAMCANDCGMGCSGTCGQTCSGVCRNDCKNGCYATEIDRNIWELSELNSINLKNYSINAYDIMTIQNCLEFELKRRWRYKNNNSNFPIDYIWEIRNITSDDIIVKSLFIDFDEKYKILNNTYALEDDLNEKKYEEMEDGNKIELPYIIKESRIRNYIKILYNSIMEQLYKD